MAFRWRIEARRARRVGAQLASLPLLSDELQAAGGPSGDQPDRHLAVARLEVRTGPRRFWSGRVRSVTRTASRPICRLRGKPVRTSARAWRPVESQP